MGPVDDSTLDDGCWTLRELAPTERADGWRQVVANTHLSWRVDPPAVVLGRPFEATVRRRRFADVDLLDCRCDPCSGSRGRPEIRSTGAPHIGVLAVLSGREILEQDGHRTELRAGDVAIWDSRRPAGFAVVEPLRKRTILLPGARVADAGRGAPPFARLLPRGTLAGDLLRAQLQALGRRPGGGPDAELAARVVADVVSGCLAELRLGAPDGGPVMVRALRATTAERRLALRQAVESYVERRLSRVRSGWPLQPDELAPDALAAAHTVSVRALQQLFEGDGRGVAAYVRRRRLEGARRQLMVDRRHTIAAIAAAWGFTDAPHFSRAYRRHFGETPTDTARQASV